MNRLHLKLSNVFGCTDYIRNTAMSLDAHNISILTKPSVSLPWVAYVLGVHCKDMMS